MNGLGRNRASFSGELLQYLGARGGAILQVGRSRVRFPMVSQEFFLDVILPAAL